MFMSTIYAYSSFIFGSAGQQSMKFICDFESLVSNHSSILGEPRMKHLREETPVQSSWMNTML